MALVPHQFLFRIAYPCRYVKGIPAEEADRLLDLPLTCRIENFGAMDDGKSFADIRLAWNEFGLGFQAEVKGKGELPRGSSKQLRGSDGITFWIDTRDARTSHRASRYCHQFHLLPSGGGPDQDEPVFSQVKIHRALQDAPLCNPSDVPFHCARTRHGYLVEAFLPAAVLNGFDAEQNPRLGFYYVVKDAELGEQVLNVGADFPYWEDPSLWSVLELVR
ncbi:MAG TPA: hypothetical protein VKU02_23070 [Gemmataceae bacterium]|nr:hypothetical protein [Gemmataceae bacterium]